ncbi:MAG: hypothetical protein H7331_07285 [Bacteroidia bacterium]|nr:hypothetical protein [Bacteroidia bacterium]
MSKTKKGSPKYGSIPKAFKKLQNKSHKMRVKKNSKAITLNPEVGNEIRLRKTHSWNYL